MLFLFGLLFATLSAAGTAAEAAAAAAAAENHCICSPFSGNEGSCCKDNDKCEHWGESLECGVGDKEELPVCCNSDFESKCCPQNSACTQGCRDSMLGSCDCIPLRNSTYVEEEALYSLVYVAASQCDEKDGLNSTWTCTACPKGYALTDLRVVEDNGHQALVGYDEDRERIVLALRGTLSFMDVIDDIKNVVAVDYEECDGCKVGKGWLDATTSIVEDVTKSLKDLSDKWGNDKEVWVTGHSLGAAMAPLVTRRIKMDASEIWNNLKWPVYTFGQPRVGNNAYSDWASVEFEKGWYRVVHHDDPVPHLPPPKLGFKHMATEIWYAEKGTGEGYYEVCNGSGEDQQCSAGTLLSGEITDHLTYLEHDITNCKDSGF